MKPRRAVFFIDGFNLYNGLKEANLYCYIWLDLVKLCNSIIKAETEELKLVKYFTSKVQFPPDSNLRQAVYLKALDTTSPKIQIIKGILKQIKEECENCGHQYYRKKEKLTDINLASHLLYDIARNELDVAYIITADIDFIPAIEFANKLNPEKKIKMLFPPGRYSKALRRVTDFGNEIKSNEIIEAQFPDIIDMNGYKLRKPEKWKNSND